MVAFDFRLVIERPEFAIWGATEPVSKLREVYDAHIISRQEFLEEHLPLIRRLLPPLPLSRLHVGKPPAL